MIALHRDTLCSNVADIGKPQKLSGPQDEPTVEPIGFLPGNSARLSPGLGLQIRSHLSKTLRAAHGPRTTIPLPNLRTAFLPSGKGEGIRPILIVDFQEPSDRYNTNSQGLPRLPCLY